MSVINQVLNQLEERGAQAPMGQTVVRAVPRTKRNIIPFALAFFIVLIAGIFAWQWMKARKPNTTAVTAPVTMAKPGVAVAAAPVITPQPNTVAAVAPVITPRPNVAIAAAPVVVPKSNATATAAPARNVLASPTLRASTELESLPLPSSLRTEKKTPPPNKTKESASVRAVKPQLVQATSLDAKTTSAKVENTKAENVKTIVQTSSSAVPMKQVSPAQMADAEFRKAAEMMQQGRIADALAGYEATLRLDAGHDAARQALVALLMEGKRSADAERVLQEGVKRKPENTGFVMLLARLQVERGAVDQAAATLEKSLPFAESQADYHAFLAALLQRQNHNDGAITHYQVALQLVPTNGAWWMGYGISLQAMQRNVDAKDAFKRALDTQTLSPDLQAFVQRKLKEL